MVALLTITQSETPHSTSHFEFARSTQSAVPRKAKIENSRACISYQREVIPISATITAATAPCNKEGVEFLCILMYNLLQCRRSTDENSQSAESQHGQTALMSGHFLTCRQLGLESLWAQSPLEITHSNCDCILVESR